MVTTAVLCAIYGRVEPEKTKREESKEEGPYLDRGECTEFERFSEITVDLGPFRYRIPKDRAPRDIEEF